VRHGTSDDWRSAAMCYGRVGSFTAALPWSVVQSHCLGGTWEPPFLFAIRRQSLKASVDTLLTDTISLSITTRDRIYTTPHHNYYIDTLQRDTAGRRRALTPNSRHVYGDAADISVPDGANWANLSNYTYKVTPARPCRELWKMSHTHLHLDFRTATGALYPVANCPAAFLIPKPPGAP
jgi:hypothetical protein